MDKTWEPKAYKNYKYLVKDPELLGGSLAIRGTRLPVWMILEGLGNGMTLEDFYESFGGFPKESLPEIFQVAKELIELNDELAA
jgi:uncharacterized protein (DUF433 family)